MSRFYFVALFAGLPVFVTAIVAGPLWAEAPHSPSPPAVLSIDDLTFPETFSEWFDEDAIPPQVRELEGKRVRIHGVMSPPPSELTKAFILMGESRTGIFLPFSLNDNPSIVGVRLKAAATYTQDPVAVEGILRLRPRVQKGRLRILYIIEEAEVRPAPIRTGYIAPRFFEC